MDSKLNGNIIDNKEQIILITYYDVKYRLSKIYFDEDCVILVFIPADKVSVQVSVKGSIRSSAYFCFIIYRNLLDRLISILKNLWDAK